MVIAHYDLLFYSGVSEDNRREHINHTHTQIDLYIRMWLHFYGWHFQSEIN